MTAKPRRNKQSKPKPEGKGKGTDAPAPRRRRCPICGRPPVADYRPFCSRRCANLDLGRWLGEDYRIPAMEPPDGGIGTGEDDEEG